MRDHRQRSNVAERHNSDNVVLSEENHSRKSCPTNFLILDHDVWCCGDPFTKLNEPAYLKRVSDSFYKAIIRMRGFPRRHQAGNVYKATSILN